MGQVLEPATVPLSGTQVIEASAGTGKTYTITSLIVRLVTEGRLGVHEICAVTFTNAAAAELKSRVEERLAAAKNAISSGDAGGDAVIQALIESPDRAEFERRLQRAVIDADRALVLTIHGFCARMLAEYALDAATMPELTLLPDDRGVVYDAVTDFWSSRVVSLAPAEFAAIDGANLHGELVALAKLVVSAPGAAIEGTAASSSDEAFASAHAAYQNDFLRARQAFSQEGAALYASLSAHEGLKRNLYRKDWLDADLGRLLAYFSAGEPAAANYPDPVGRWTQSYAAKSVKKGKTGPVHPLLAVLETHRELARGVILLGQQRRQALLMELAHEIEVRIEREHASQGTSSFDGLLRRLHDALADPVHGARLGQTIRSRYPALLIDEFQDTDPIQYDIFRRIHDPDGEASHASSTAALLLVGDPKQSIYRFRGADVDTYLGARRVRGRAVWTLETSYRAGPSLVQAQNAVFGFHDRPFGTTAIGYVPVSARPKREDELLGAGGEPAPGLRLLQVEDEDLVTVAATEVARMLQAGLRLNGNPLSPKHIAVLTRTNAEATQVQALLHHLGIPAIMHGDRSVFESSEAHELRRVLRALIEPGHRGRLHTALATRLVGLTAHELAALGTDPEALEFHTDRVRRWATTWRLRGIALALDTAFSEANVLERTLVDADGERRMTNFRHLTELLHGIETEQHLGMFGLLRAFESAIAAPTGHAMAAEARQVRLESDDDAVTITTVHKSKGLEYELVVLPQIARVDQPRKGPAVRYRDPDRAGLEVLHVLGSRGGSSGRTSSGRTASERRSSERSEADERALALWGLEEQNEALRLGYVGLTRARHQVVALYPKQSGFSALGWFLHGGRVGKDDPERAPALKRLAEEETSRDLLELVRRSNGTVSVESLPVGAAALELAPRWERGSRSAAPLAPPALVLGPERARRTSSFSAMTRASEVLSRAEREGRDVDPLSVSAVSVSATVAPGVAATTPDPLGTRIVLADFPRGAGPGDALHAIFEQVPMADGRTAEGRMAEGKIAEGEALIARELGRAGIDALHVPQVERAVAAALEVRLLDSGERLADLEPRERAVELEFTLPIGSDARAFSPRHLGAVLRRHAGEGIFDASYVSSVERLSFAEFRGFLRGFMDLVFFKGGRLYVLDYKSNYLGDRYDDYEPAKLSFAMASHHYFLQGLLYATATHLYGRQRIAQYSYEEHFGEVIYLFLRGLEPNRPDSSRGSFRFRPSAQLIDDLCLAFRGEVRA